MQSKRLAQWLQDHTETLGAAPNKQDSAFHTALYEGIIDVALSGDTRMLDSVVESAAAHAVAVERELTDLLDMHQAVRQRIWDRIGEEIDPEPAFIMLAALDSIFNHATQVTVAAYTTNSRLALAAKSAELSRLYAEAEQKVMRYATEVSRANRELARLEKAKTDFISIAAHELKTPLTLIQGYVNILHDLEEDGSQGKNLTEGIDRGVQRMNSILDDMLDLSAMDLGKLRLVLQPVNLAKMIRLIIVQSEASLQERQQTIAADGLEELPEIQADITRLHQVFRQLVSNAIKYTPNGGHITVSGSAPPNADHITVLVSDTGVGIAPEDQEKIFEKFYRASDSSLHSTGKTKFMGAGPGLGLAIVKGLVTAHGGRVLAESPGFDMQNCPGSTFAVQLPLTAAPPPGVAVQWIGSKKLMESQNSP
ncbi:MAG: Adaptive-response sensory-kinase SasA [Anaerolineae bacterium]|nr:Adaptive-response sensory-kinase SasA [Anaerolineae bacterium]